MTTMHEERLRNRRDRLEQMGLTHPEDIYLVRKADTNGVGFLRKADYRGGRLQVDVEAGGVTLYLDTTNPQAITALFNLSDLQIGTRVTLSANIRCIDTRGVRLGRLSLMPCDVPIDKAIFRPAVRSHGLIRLGEGDMVDPDPSASGFYIVPNAGVAFVPVREW